MDHSEESSRPGSARTRNCVVVVRPQRILDNEADPINAD
jgi:hypothetical protein